ncbi:MAG: glycosyl hydrolase [Bacteroidota bacterium]
MNQIIFLFVLFLSVTFWNCKKQETNSPPSVGDTTIVQTPFKSLNYLYRISGKNVVAGIHNREPNSSPAAWTNQIYSTTGKYPGLWSGDFLFQADNIANRQTMINEAINQWQHGALISILWHACNPALSEPCGWDANGVLSRLSDDQWTQLITDGTTINSKWKAMMDEVAVYLQQLKDNGVEVLWRPLHEMNQQSFWWGGRPGANGTRKLFQITHDYLKNIKGLTNLIWVWDVQDFTTLASDVINYNPGNDYWEVLALDIYGNGGFSLPKYNTIVAAAGGKPIAIGECSKLPIADELGAQPKWTFFMSWSELTYSSNSDAEIQALYNNSRVVTRDKLPGW